jgi:hypothetical protein
MLTYVQSGEAFEAVGDDDSARITDVVQTWFISLLTYAQFSEVFEVLCYELRTFVVNS